MKQNNFILHIFYLQRNFQNTIPITDCYFQNVWICTYLGNEYLIELSIILLRNLLDCFKVKLRGAPWRTQTNSSKCKMRCQGNILFFMSKFSLLKQLSSVFPYVGKLIHKKFFRFEAEISGTEAAAAAGLMRPVIGSGTYGAIQQRLEAAPMAQYQQARLSTMMYPGMPPPPPPPPSRMVPQQVCAQLVFISWKCICLNILGCKSLWVQPHHDPSMDLDDTYDKYNYWPEIA